jgi:hypothetical protein
MKRYLGLLAAATTLIPRFAHADVNVIKNKDAELNVGAMTQVMGLGQKVDDPVREDGRVFLFVKEARFRANGGYDDFTFNFEMALGGEEPVNTNVSLSLLDLSANIPLGSKLNYVKVGQFKVPYGRERLTYSGTSQFLERSVMDLGFRVGRDVGASVNLNPGPFTIIGGIFTGGGRDAPQRYLPEYLGVPMLVARAGIGDVDDDLYALKNDLGTQELKNAFFVNALWTKDTRVGHSTVLNVKANDKSILLNPNWNPYIAKTPYSTGIWWQVGADWALRAPMGTGSLSAEAEVNWAGYENNYGVAHVAGARAQAGYFFKPIEIALRYSVLLPDKAFSTGTASVCGSDPIHEVTPTATWYLSGQRLKLVADLPILLGVPVFTEQGIGSYVASEMPDQASVLKTAGNTMGRQNVVEARLMLQAAF